MIARDIQRDLAEVAIELERIGTDHGECLSCHCYREVAEEMLESLGVVLGHAELFKGPIPSELTQGRGHLRRLLDAGEGKHG